MVGTRTAERPVQNLDISPGKVGDQLWRIGGGSVWQLSAGEAYPLLHEQSPGGVVMRLQYVKIK